MNTEPHPAVSSDSSPGKAERREQLLRAYDDLDDAGKLELVEFALHLAGRKS